MKATKMSISLESELGEEVREAARKAGKGLSAWLAEAAAEKLRAEALDEFLDQWQRENGPITPEELRRARAKLDLTPADTHS